MKKLFLFTIIASIFLSVLAYDHFFLNKEKKPSNLYFIYDWAKPQEKKGTFNTFMVILNLPPWQKPIYKNLRAKYVLDCNINRTPNSPVSIEEARCLLVSFAQKIQGLILEDPQASKELGNTAFSSGDVQMNIFFLYKNLLLEQGIAVASIINGNIVLEKYTISQDEFPYPVGKLSLVLEENFLDSLEKVKSQGCIDLFNN